MLNGLRLVFEIFFRRHIVLWALLTGFALGSLTTANAMRDDRVDPHYPPPIMSHDSCMDNPGLCAMDEEVHKQLIRDQITEQINTIRFEKLHACVEDPGCALMGDEQDEYEKLMGEVQ